MKTKMLLLVFAYLCIFTGIVAHAQGTQTPEEVAKASMDFTSKGDWSSYAKLMHPEALTQAKRLFQPLVAADKSGELLELFFGVKTVKQFDALSDAGVFEALMINITKNIPGFTDALKTVDFKLVGSVLEGEELVHVVYRTGAQVKGINFSNTSVMTLRRHQGQWRLILDSNLEGLAASISEKLSGSKK